MDCFTSRGYHFCPYDVNKCAQTHTHTHVCLYSHMHERPLHTTHTHARACTHTDATRAATGNRMKMKAERGRREEEKKSREEKSPCGRGRFSSSVKSADPSLSLICPPFTATASSLASFFPSPFHQPHPTVSSGSLFSHLTSFLSSSSIFLSLHSTPHSAPLYFPLSLFQFSLFRVISHSVFHLPLLLSVTVGELQADRGSIH